MRRAFVAALAAAATAADPAPPLRAGWREYLVTEGEGAGRVAYYNNATRATVWNRPESRAGPNAAPAPPAAAPAAADDDDDAARAPAGAFSWKQAQKAMAACAGTSAPRPGAFVFFKTKQPLGNGLNAWMHVFVYALVTGRQPAVGWGSGPSKIMHLMCGPEGAFACGLPYYDDAWLRGRRQRSIFPGKWNVFDKARVFDDVPVHVYDARSGYQWRSSEVWIERFASKKHARCVRTALRCAGAPLDAEACLMARAAQLLLPGPRLRPAFAAAALREADHWWLGNLSDFRSVVRASTAPADWDADLAATWRRRPVFRDPAPDAGARWRGAIHVRSLAPHLERYCANGKCGKKDRGDGREQELFERFIALVKNSSLWPCAVRDAGAGDQALFLATDAKGLCRAVRAAEPRVACFDVEPTHLTKQPAVALHRDHDLHSHQAVLLDWFFLSRSRWLAPVMRNRNTGRCVDSHARAGVHSVHHPGKSFFGWALAASGLVPPPPSRGAFRCACEVTAASVSVMPSR